ncbi:MAG: acetylxylan esterase [Anaerolineaceae bacterium]|nr:acetylxylan esterase [Anaerolineaceae bacterium]
MKYSDINHFQSLYKNINPDFGFNAKTTEEFTIWQDCFCSQLREVLGLHRLQNDLKDFQPFAHQIDEEETGEFIRQRWVLQVEPTVPLPFILLKPKVINGQIPLVLTPHGHAKNTEMYAGIVTSPEEEQFMLEGDRDIAVQAVREGYLVIAPTTRGFGETRTEQGKAEDTQNSCRDLLVHDLLVGRTPTGDRVWDISRFIDWAFEVLPVDRERVAITGNSTGGTISLFAAALDERITLSAPGSYFCTFAGSIGSIQHCECNYIPGLLTLGEMADVAGLIAPRPFMAINGKEDPIYPIDEVYKAFEQLKKIYAIAGVPENVELFVGEGGHRYYKAEVWPFIRRYFSKNTGTKA